MSKLQQKAIDCLRVAALPIGSKERLALIDEVVACWSYKAAAIKMDELVERGYVEPLKFGMASGNLTEKGRLALAEASAEE